MYSPSYAGARAPRGGVTGQGVVLIDLQSPLESLSLSFLAGKCCVILRALLSQKAEGEHRSSRSHLAIESLCNIRQAGRGVEQELTALMRLLVLCFASFVIIVCSDLSSVASQPRQRACSAAALRSLHLGQLFQYRPRMGLQEASMSEVFARKVYKSHGEACLPAAEEGLG